MLSDEEIIRSFDTEVTVAVVSFLERIGIDPHLEKFTTLPDEKIKQDFIEAYRSLREIFPSLEDIPVRIATFSKADGGYALIDKSGNCGAILLNKLIIGSTKKAALERQNIDFGIKTNNPIGAILIHEFGHSLWTPQLYTNDETDYAIIELYIDWEKEYKSGKLPEYGKYVASNIDEWWAELFAKAIIGPPDKFTQRAIEITKKYLL